MCMGVFVCVDMFTYPCVCVRPCHASAFVIDFFSEYVCAYIDVHVRLCVHVSVCVNVFVC